MFELYQKTLHKLELDRVLQMLSECAGSDDGKELCLQIMPTSDLGDVNNLLNETTEAVELSLKKNYPSFTGNKNVLQSLDRAFRGGCLQTKELLEIAGCLRCARSVKAYSEDCDLHLLQPLFSALQPNKYLEERIFATIISEDEISDTASSELSDIRRHMRVQKSKIKDLLQKIISSPSQVKFLREPIITIRQGRYVVPVKSECKNDIQGLVHDVSSTGSTYFIEPVSVVNANNALRELEANEKKEVERILFELSADVSTYKDVIDENYRMLLRLDVIFAKAKLAEKMKACAPVMNDRGIIDLRNARHPLIDSDKVVPISLHLGGSFDSMIITGPNTGGKTVTLKTVGLLTLMAECGMHLPVAADSQLSTFEAILADIGDEQSIAQSLSTFSSHMRTLIQIVDKCNNRSLVLLDELGAGTDPAEGAALAIALIEFCRKMGSCVVATTHYAEMKLYAMRTDGVINASCEFSVETLQPTYRLLIGIPGKSNAFAISRKLGLPEEILKEASDLISNNNKDFEDVLSKLEMQRHEMERAQKEVENLRVETEKIRNTSAQYEEQLQKERDKALEQARLQAQKIIDDARAAANAATDEIKALKRQLQETGDVYSINQRQSDIRKKLNQADELLRTNQPQNTRSKASRAIIVGDTVELLKFGTKASVLAINKDGTYQLQAGILKLTANEDEIYLIENSGLPKLKSKPAHSGKELKLNTMQSEIDLRGMDSIEAICVLERYLDEAMRSNLPSVRIIHGKGTGVLRSSVQQSLRKNKFVKKFRLGVYGEGEDGVTIAEFV